MGNASDAKYGRLTGRRWIEIVGYVLQTKGSVCHLCRHDGANTADHVLPISLGGHPTAIDNLEPAHRYCNLRRGNKTLAEWFAKHPVQQRPALAPSREW